MLLQDGWISLTDHPEQLWRFELHLVLGVGLLVEISYAEIEDPWTKLGAEIVWLSPKIVLGQFRGFEGTDGLVRYRFSDIGSDIRIDIDHPADGLPQQNYVLFASPILSELATLDANPRPSKEMQDKFTANLLRLAWPILPLAQQIIDLAEQPGDWFGVVEIGADAHEMIWHVAFGKKGKHLFSAIETSSDFGAAQHLLTLQPHFFEGQFQGMYGKHADRNPYGLVAEYLFQVRNGTLVLQVLHHMQAILGDDVTLKFHVPLELNPEDF